MKTILISSIICLLCSLLPALVICLFGVDEAPTPWDAMTMMFLGFAASTLVWLGVVIWAGLKLVRKTARPIPLWVRLIFILLAAGYIGSIAMSIIYG